MAKNRQCPVSDSLDLLFRQEGATLEELADFRALVEGHCGFVAAQNATASELDSVESQFQALRDLGNSGSSNWQTFVEREVEFHFTVANLSHNRVSMAVLHALNTWPLSFSPHIPEDCKERILRDWETIIRAIRNHVAQGAQSVISEHIRFFGKLSTSR